MHPPKLLVVVPCYNEEAVLAFTFGQLSQLLNTLISSQKISADSKICFVNDGSRDNTWQIIEQLKQNSSLVKGIKLARNFGHQNALLAGLTENVNQYDCYVSIDADLQDDAAAIAQMIDAYTKGSKVVYGVRNDRTKDSWFKRNTAQGFYKIMISMGIPLVYNHADFRLIDNQVLNELGRYREVNMFLRGVIPTIGFKSEEVFYKRTERTAGESKYPLQKMLVFAWNGITSFSVTPMRMVLWFGVFNFLLSIVILCYILFSKIYGSTVQGWTSIVLPMAFFSGANMVAVGLIGEYIGRIYEEVKQRPRYIVDHTI